MSLTSEQLNVLEEFISGLRDVAWFERCGEHHSGAIVVADLCDGWDDWNAEMLDVWSIETHGLEKAAVEALGDASVTAIFDSVSTTLGERLSLAIQGYFQRQSEQSSDTSFDASFGLWYEWLDAVKRDLAWAAVEAVLDRPGFFTDLLCYYRAGRWPCAWENSDRSGRVVLL